MKLGMFMMPMHPADRPAWETLEEDRQAIILADQLGYHDVFVGEHLSDRIENITSSIMKAYQGLRLLSPFRLSS